MIRSKALPRRIRASAFFVALALLIALALPALAAVTLTEFTATPLPDGTIRIYWAAATELDTASYQLFRAETTSPAGGWGAPICQKVAGGSLSPASYECIDPNVTPGVTYYYMLSDISVQGVAGQNGPVEARVPVAGETPTNTPSPTPTLNFNIPTITPGPGVPVSTATPTTPPPTATQRFTNTPVVAPVGTPVLSSPTAVIVAGRATATRLPGASLATPTGQPQIPTVPPVAVVPTVAVVAAAPPTETPTITVVTQAPGAGAETATPVPTREVTPIIFAASETREAETLSSVETVAAQGSRNMTPALAIGGGLLGLAGIAAAALLFLKSRKG